MYGVVSNSQQIRKIITVFGTLFNNIIVQREDANNNTLKTFTVPISYGPKSHYMAKLEEESKRASTNVSSILPRLSFEFTDLQYNISQKLNPLSYQKRQGSTSDVRKQMLAPAPYIITFDLNVWTKNTTDALEIIEQILPYFQPNISVTIIDNEEMNVKKDVNFTLTGVDVPVDYEGSIEDNDRIIKWTLSFDAEVNIYPPVKELRAIKKAISNVIDNNNGIGKTDASLTVAVNPPSAAKEGIYTIDRLIEEF